MVINGAIENYDRARHTRSQSDACTRIEAVGLGMIKFVCMGFMAFITAIVLCARS